jgi:hypothetical protein
MHRCLLGQEERSEEAEMKRLFVPAKELSAAHIGMIVEEHAGENITFAPLQGFIKWGREGTVSLCLLDNAVSHRAEDLITLWVEA